jgi:hypothetical protein
VTSTRYVCAAAAVSTAALCPRTSPAAVTNISPLPTKKRAPELGAVVMATATGPRLFSVAVPDVNRTVASTTIGSGNGFWSWFVCM